MLNNEQKENVEEQIFIKDMKHCSFPLGEGDGG